MIPLFRRTSQSQGDSVQQRQSQHSRAPAAVQQTRVQFGTTRGDHHQGPNQGGETETRRRCTRWGFLLGLCL